MPAREQILGRIRLALKPDRSHEACSARLHAHPHNLIPERGRVTQTLLVQTFIDLAEEAAATAEQVPDISDVIPSVIRYLARHQLPKRVCMAEVPVLRMLARRHKSALTITHKIDPELDQTTLTTAVGGIAETGTIMVASGAGHPSGLSFLPSNHLVILGCDQIVANLEQAWELLRARGQPLPRHVSCITGPSRTADIEQKIQLGVHGPKRLHLIVVTAGLSKHQ